MHNWGDYFDLFDEGVNKLFFTFLLLYGIYRYVYLYHLLVYQQGYKYRYLVLIENKKLKT